MRSIRSCPDRPRSRMPWNGRNTISERPGTAWHGSSRWEHASTTEGVQMSGRIIDGTALARRIRQEVKEQVDAFRRDAGRVPGLAVVLVGDDPASQVYVRTKERACGEVGIRSQRHHLPGDATQKEVLELVEGLGKDDTVDGILVQLPLPRGLDPQPILHAVPPAKDVDGFHPYNLGRLT